MKKIMSLIICLLSCVYVQGEPVCNSNDSKGSAGIPQTSCFCSLSTFSLGMNQGYFFIDTGYDVSYNGGTYRLRVGVTSNSSYYNDFQAIVQTAYATRSVISLIYPNFALMPVKNASYDGLSDLECRINTDNNGAPANMYCPIQAITLSN